MQFGFMESIRSYEYRGKTKSHYFINLREMKSTKKKFNLNLVVKKKLFSRNL